MSQCGEAWVEEQIRNRIGVEPKAMVGKPVIRGTRIPVELIAPRRMLAQGIPESGIMREYPGAIQMTSALRWPTRYSIPDA